jgi:hypothetical protein
LASIEAGLTCAVTSMPPTWKTCATETCTNDT